MSYHVSSVLSHDQLLKFEFFLFHHIVNLYLSTDGDNALSVMWRHLVNIITLNSVFRNYFHIRAQINFIQISLILHLIATNLSDSMTVTT